MRLWSIHPKYLDCKGLTALWREGLLAKKVLSGQTRGYKKHPQLIRFSKADDPYLIETYLYHVMKAAECRSYCFDKTKLGKRTKAKIPVNKGQVNYEFRHLIKKLKKRDAKKAAGLEKIKRIQVNPIFFIVKGGIEEWEKKSGTINT